MKLFVGLGNPGEKYEKTPHSAGFRAVDKLRNFFGYSSAYDVGDWEYDKYLEAFISVGKTENHPEFVIAKPNTFMNESGRAVVNIVKKFEINVEKELVLFYDDLDIKLGNYKIQRGKTPKGHKGLISVFQHLKTFDFFSVRIGIENRTNPNIPGEDYVLTKYSEEELKLLDEAIAESIKKLRFNITL
jgi:peptidyl-tRNA hydrolase, PTH1 family